MLPPRYHPDGDRKMLRAAGDTGDIVDQIQEGLHISGCNFSAGYYDLLPSPSGEELEGLKNNPASPKPNTGDGWTGGSAGTYQ